MSHPRRGSGSYLLWLLLLLLTVGCAAQQRAVATRNRRYELTFYFDVDAHHYYNVQYNGTLLRVGACDLLRCRRVLEEWIPIGCDRQLEAWKTLDRRRVGLRVACEEVSYIASV